MMRGDLPEAICNTYLINILNRRNFRPLKLLIKNRWTTYIAAVNRIASGVWNSRGRDNEYLVWRMNSNETALSINYAIHSPLLKFPSVSLNAPKLANVENAAGITKSFYWRHRAPIEPFVLVLMDQSMLFVFMLLFGWSSTLKHIYTFHAARILKNTSKSCFSAETLLCREGVPFFLTTRANLSRVWRRR